MDGNRFESDSNFLHNKCATRRFDCGVDRISELGDELIVAIVCFLPLRDAARSSVLSRRWLDMWKHTPNMKFDRISQLPDEVLVVILSLLPLKDAAATSVLSSRWSELWKHTPNLNFSYSTISYRMRHTEIKGSSWDVERSKYVQLVDSVLQSHKAISLKEFGISFYVNKSAHIKLANWLQIVFLRGVERLKLDVNLNGFYSDPEYEVVLEELLRGSGLCRPQTLILFKSLKRLCPKWLKVSGEDIKLFLGNCPLLEELIIGEGNWTSDVEVCGASLKLKDLEAYGCYAKKSIKFLLQILLGLRSTMHQRRCFFANVFIQMPNLEKLVVEYFGVKFQSLLPVTALVWASPRLEEFKFLYRKKADQSSGEVVRKVERCPHRFLKVFELAGLLGVADHIELVTYISDNCVALQKIIIGCEPFSVFTNFDRDYSEIRKEKQDIMDYAKQQLQGKLPQHVQLQLLN